MTREQEVSTVPARGAGSIAIIVTVVTLSVWGAVGLWDAMSLPLAVVGAGWAVITVAVWGLYGLALLVLVRRPLRRAHLTILGVVLALAWGGLAATDISGSANTAVQTLAVNLSSTGDGAWTTWAIYPVVEETVKTLGIVMLALLPVAARFGPGAGLAVGALVGVGFQVVENVVFTVQGMSDAADQPGQALLSMVFIRGLVGVFSHVVYSGVIGAAVGWALLGGPQERGRRLAVAVAVWVGMVALHALGNWAAQAQAAVLYLLAMILGLVVLILVSRRALPREEPAAAVS